MSELHQRFSGHQRMQYLAGFFRLFVNADGFAGRVSAVQLLVVFLRMKLGVLKQYHAPIQIRVGGLVFIVDVTRYDQSPIFEIVLDKRYDRFDRRLSNEPVIFDCGANTGVFSLAYWHKFPRSRIFAFEPSPPTYRRFTENLMLNKCDPRCVTQFNCAVSDNPGTCLFFNSDVSLNSHVLSTDEAGTIRKDQTTVVTTDTLDRIVTSHRISRIDLLKIDTEGYELPVLRGAAKNALPICRYVILEIHSISDYDSVARIMSNAGFILEHQDRSMVFYERGVPV